MQKNNLDPTEIAKFSKLANRWWDKSSEFKSLHDINPLRLNYIEEHAPLADKRVLDVGCGGGILAEGMAFRGANVTGIDISDTSLSIAKVHALESQLNIEYRNITPENLAREINETENEKFDVVTCLEMLEHVPDPAAIIQACAQLIKPNGHLFFSTINRNPKSYLFAIIGAEYILNLIPRGIHEYNKFIRPSELASWLRNVDLPHFTMTGMTYNPLLKQYKFAPHDLDVNYLAHVHNIAMPNE